MRREGNERAVADVTTQSTQLSEMVLKCHERRGITHEKQMRNKGEGNSKEQRGGGGGGTQAMVGVERLVRGEGRRAVSVHRAEGVLCCASICAVRVSVI